MYPDDAWFIRLACSICESVGPEAFCLVSDPASHRARRLGAQPVTETSLSHTQIGAER